MALPTSAFAAPGDTHSLDFDLEALAKALETKPNLEGFSGMGVEFDNEAEKAIASVENLESMYNGESYLESKPFPGLKEVAGAELKVQEWLDELKSGMDSLPSDGTAEAEIASEVEAEAEATGISVTSAVGVALATVPITAVLAYEDYTSGSNVVYRALFGGKEDYEELHESVGAEAFRWNKYKYFASTKLECTKGGVFSEGNNVIGQCIQDQFIEKYGTETKALEVEAEDHFKPRDYNDSLSPYNWEVEGSPVWILEPKVAGNWYLGGESEVLTSCYDTTVYPAAFCSEWPWVGGYSIGGWPSHLLKQETEFWAGGERFEHDCNPCHSVIDVGEVRQNHFMHTGLPRPTTPEHIKKLEEEGHEVRKGEAKAGTEATEPGIIKKAGEEVHKHGHKSQEKTECHYLRCETSKKETETAEKTDPVQPEKAEDTPPPVAGEAEVPSCFITELSSAACKSLLQERGFTDVEIDVRTWEHAVVTKPAEAVVSVSPAAGSYVELSSKLVVEANPSPSGMPVELPDPGTETATKYKERLEKEAWTKVSVKTATEPVVGVDPGQVARVSPQPDTPIDPATEPRVDSEVDIEEQPEGSPEPGLPPGAGVGAPGCGLTPPTASIDLSPVTSHNFGSVFPFSVLTWLSGTFSGTAETAREPHAVLHVFGSEVETGNGFAPLASIFTLLRDTIAAFMWLGVAWFLWNRTIGSRTS